MTVMLQTEHNLEFLSLKGGCTCLSESTLVKIQHCWKLCVVAQIRSTRIILASSFLLCCQLVLERDCEMNLGFLSQVRRKTRLPI